MGLTLIKHTDLQQGSGQWNIWISGLFNVSFVPKQQHKQRLKKKFGFSPPAWNETIQYHPNITQIYFYTLMYRNRNVSVLLNYSHFQQNSCGDCCGLAHKRSRIWCISHCLWGSWCKPASMPVCSSSYYKGTKWLNGLKCAWNKRLYADFELVWTILK